MSPNSSINLVPGYPAATAPKFVQRASPDRVVVQAAVVTYGFSQRVLWPSTVHTVPGLHFSDATKRSF